jgi:hypothetical protein
MRQVDLWRIAFFTAGVLVIAGAWQHPRDPTMAEMLANPNWFMSHALMTVGFGAMLAGLLWFGRDRGSGMAGVTRLTIGATALQLFEMALHTAAMVDHDRLIADDSTPVLSTHLVMAVLFYPVFGAAAIAFIVAGIRTRTLGSPWIGWLGIIGAAAHGLSAPLVVGLNVNAVILFPMLMLFALWLVLAAIWPLAPRG